MDRYEACIRSQALYEDLCRIVDGDPGQEVYGIAVPVIDELLTACKQFVPDDPVVKSIEGLMRPEIAGRERLARGRCDVGGEPVDTRVAVRDGVVLDDRDHGRWGIPLDRAA